MCTICIPGAAKCSFYNNYVGMDYVVILCYPQLPVDFSYMMDNKMQTIYWHNCANYYAVTIKYHTWMNCPTYIVAYENV